MFWTGGERETHNAAGELKHSPLVATSVLGVWGQGS